MLFSNRKEAGQQLAGRLAAFANRVDVIVLSLIPGGVPVGFEISRSLNLCFDVFPIFKFYSPYNADFAFGARSLNDFHYFDEQLTNKLGVHASLINFLEIEAKLELEKLNLLYRNGKSWVDLEGKIIILVDDGSCSEDDIHFASKIILDQDPKGLIIASPILSLATCEQFDESIENIICIAESNDEVNIDNCYQELSHVSDNEVNLLFERTHLSKYMN